MAVPGLTPLYEPPAQHERRRCIGGDEGVFGRTARTDGTDGAQHLVGRRPHEAPGRVVGPPLTLLGRRVGIAEEAKGDGVAHAVHGLLERAERKGGDDGREVAALVHLPLPAR